MVDSSEAVSNSIKGKAERRGIKRKSDEDSQVDDESVSITKDGQLWKSMNQLSDGEKYMKLSIAASDKNIDENFERNFEALYYTELASFLIAWDRSVALKKLKDAEERTARFKKHFLKEIAKTQALEQTEARVAIPRKSLLEKFSDMMTRLSKVDAQIQIQIDPIHEHFFDSKEAVASWTLSLPSLKADVSALKDGLDKLKDYLAGLKADIPILKDDLSVAKVETFGIRDETIDLKYSIGSCEADVAILKGEITAMEYSFTIIKSIINRLSMIVVCSENRKLRVLGSEINRIPFANGMMPGSEFPEIKECLDIDNLTKDQCRDLLDGFEISYTLRENISLKYKLRVLHGLTLTSDMKYVYHRFPRR